MNLGLTGEDLIHSQIVEWARRQEKTQPYLCLLFHPANGGTRSPATGMKMKALGVKPGTPDLCLPVARGGFHGLWLEVKDTKGRLSPHQELWLSALKAEGHRAEVVRSSEEGIGVICGYLQLPPNMP